MGTITFHPWPVRSDDVDHPDELRIDLDPQPGRDFADAVRVAAEARVLLDELGYTGFPKTSGGRGVHIYVRIARRWTFTDVRPRSRSSSPSKSRNASSASLVSCKQTTFGRRSSSQGSSRGTRCLTELTFRSRFAPTPRYPHRRRRPLAKPGGRFDGSSNRARRDSARTASPSHPSARPSSVLGNHRKLAHPWTD
jgi:LigD, primase-polymerase domain